MDMLRPKYFGFALVLVTGLVLGEEPRTDMRVEEPAPGRALPPVNPDHDSGGWQGRTGSEAPLSPSEKASLQSRRRKMEAMLATIREKREALQKANGEDKELLVQELSEMVLDASPEKVASDKQLKKAEWKARKSEQAQEKEARKAEKTAKDKASKGKLPQD